MLRIHRSDGTFIVEVEGRLDRAQLEEMTVLIERSLSENDKTHIYVEVRDFSGFDAAALPDYLPRAAAMVRQLDRFGRIAVVANQSWVRALTRIESAILPGISYETYAPDEKAHALAWVEGREPHPHPGAIKVIESDRADVFGFELDGRLTRREIEAVSDYFQHRFEEPGSVSLLGRIRRIEGIDPLIFFSGNYFRMKLNALQKVDRYALVGGPAWLEGWVEWVDPLVKADIRHFDADEEGIAWAWLGAEPKSERALAA